MSIVERALKKLQSTGQRETADTRPPDRALAAGRVVARQRAADPDASPARRPAPIEHSGRTVAIDHEMLRQIGLLAPENQQRELDHQYRTLKRPLIKHAFRAEGKSAPGGASPRSIMVTSALPGEGKTFTTINLALSLSLERDHGVLLVDGDVAKPHVSHIFGLADEPGLLDVLTDANRPIESVVLPTDVAGLRVLPVGRRSDAATELLASARMRQVIARLEDLDPQGLVVVDSPPILLTSEARVLASLFGQVVLVVRAGGTPQQAVQEAIGIIGEGPRLGLVLNQAIHDGRGGSYYGSGYGYGYGYDDKAAVDGAPGGESGAN